VNLFCLFGLVWFDSNLTSSFCCCRVGIVFCGRQSPGGHNVIWGLHSALKIHNPNSVLLGFLGNLHD
jgi:pyrophosphate--fructose-6-phosphate 1-phosphotransferase